jgi:hypothetical protein
MNHQDNEHIWTPAGTDVTIRWRMNGWVPPSEVPEYQAKWDFYQKISTRRIDDKAKQELDAAIKRAKVVRVR